MRADPLPPNATPWPAGHAPTAFERAVIDAVSALAAGDLATYGELAEAVGSPGAGQAVANVLRRFDELPWWRVVPTDGRLYRSHAPIQGPLLEGEGHHIDENRRVRTRAASTAREPRA
jgi:methylated-DNA-protein-cysteine methyltransferase-like protein